MIKVLHVMGRFEGNGAERQLLSTLSVAKQGLWDPTLLVLRPHGSYLEAARRAGIAVITLPDAHDFDPRRAGHFRRARVATDAFDVVHSSLWGANTFARLCLPGP